jgi:phenylalanyl-tRNA synthetase alpha chain
MAETLQQLILDTLDAKSTIKDTRDLSLPGQSEPAASHEAQITILGALNSLLSRDVRTISFSLLRLLTRSIDDKV